MPRRAWAGHYASVLNLPVVDPWFVVATVANGVTQVTEPHVHRLLRCNVWHVLGRDRDLVVDTSLGLTPMRHLIERRHDRRMLAVATHVHADHVGGMHEFDDRAIHAAEAERLAEPGSITLDISAYGDEVRRPYLDAGYDVPDILIDAMPMGGVEASMTRLAAPPTLVLHEGDVIDLGDRVFEVLHLPGHSVGSIGLWEQATGVFFSGDAVYDGPLLDELEGCDIEAYIATMRRLRQLPVEVVHGGHEQSFGRDRLVQLCDQYLSTRT